MTNGISQTNADSNDCIEITPIIKHINITRIQPCCVTIKDDLRFIAAGFENSHIYLWSLDSDDYDKNDKPELLNSAIKVNSMFTLLGHTGSVYDIKFINQQSDLMLSCSEDYTIRLWCLKNKCNVFIYRGHNYPIWSLDVSPHGDMFVSASMDTTARLWCLDRITPIRIFCGHDDDVECARFHPNEKYVATGSSDTTIRLWSVSDGKMVRSMVGHRTPIISLSFLPNGKFLASASRDGCIKIWNLAINTATIESTIPASLTISFSLEQKFISSCGVDNVLRIYKLDPGIVPTTSETTVLELTEKKSLNFQAQDSKLIQSQFIHKFNKLFVIGSNSFKKR